MMRHKPFILRAGAWLVPARYRAEVIGDLLDEWSASIRPRRGAAYANVWLLAHILRSAVAARRHRAPASANAAPRDLQLIADEFRADWRLARRNLGRSPLFTTVALLILMVAIGLSTAVFSLVTGVLLQPLPYRDADRLVRLSQFRADAPAPPVRGGLLASVTIGAWMQEAEALDAIVPYSSNGTTTVGIAGAHEQLVIARVGGRLFDVLGVTPEAGRLLHDADVQPDAPDVAVVSRRLWSELSAAGGPAERVITIDRVPHTVVGVVPADFAFPSPDVEVWVPGRWRWPAAGGRANFSMSLEVLARRRASASLEDVQAEGERVLRSIAMADPNFFEGTVSLPTLRVVPLRDHVVGEARPALQALFAGMVLVLAAACASLANLLVARNSARARDIAIRTTLGATRRRLLRPLLLEQAALVGAGAVLGGLSGRWILDVLPAIAPQLPRLAEVRLDWTAFAAAVTLALATALAVGLRPAWQRGSADLRELSGSNRLRAGAGSRSAELFRGALVMAQVALAVVLLVGASLVGRSLWNLLSESPGYDPRGVLTFQVGLPSDAWEERGRQTRFYEELIERLEGLGGVTSAAFASKLPLHTGHLAGTFFIEGVPRAPDPADNPRAHNVMVSPGYLRTIGTRLLAGRAFEARDDQQAMPVVLVDELLSTRYFGGNAIGRRVHSIGGKIWTVVGVVESVKLGALSAAGEPVIYFPYTQVGEMLTFNRLSTGVVVRASSDPASIAPAVRQIVSQLDPASPPFNIMPLSDRLDRTLDQPRFYTIALVLFALMTLGSAILGVYGLQAYAVERRTAEFGVRRALGATEGAILALVLKRALVLAAAGAAVGLPLAALGAGLMRALLFGVQPLDPATLAASPAAVFLLVLAASWQPARRAMRIDPARALRCD
jgi:putative ABC transport system permease protein